ncbi:MAG: hypothetical protein ACKO1F_00140 [Flammeovirgaceae bacterium]
MLRDSVRLSLDGVPHSIDFGDVRKTALQVMGIKDFYHLLSGLSAQQKIPLLLMWF